MTFRCLMLLLVPVTLLSCGPESAPQREGPSLVREKPAEANPDSDPLPAFGDGNFESLVADYESKDRVIWQKPDIVIALLGDLQGKTVADIGAGTGYFTFRMVSKANKVIGIDIDPRFIDFMDSVKVRLPLKYRTHFESRLAKADDPLLQAEEVDACIIVNTYGYIDNRIAYLEKLWKGIKPGGQLLIIDFKKNNLPIGPPDQFKVASGLVRRELESSGFKVLTLDNNTLDYQYIVLAAKPAEAPGH